MAKRRATTELNRDNWDVEEESEDPGTFKRLTEDQLKNRIIRKAKRSLGNRETSGSSPFAAFSGFAKSTSSTNPFNILMNNSSSQESSSFDTPANKGSKKENGNSITGEEKKTSETEVAERKQVKENSSSSDKQKPMRNIEYYRQLQSLNESVTKWMQLHLAKNSCCDFTPVFNDYMKHLDTLNFIYPVKSKDSSAVERSVQSSVLKEDSSSTSSNKTVIHGMKLSNSSKDNDETDYGANFKSNTTNTSTFSFGIKKATTMTSSNTLSPPPSFKEEEAAPEKKQFQFSFGLKKADDSSATKQFNFPSIINRNADSESTSVEESDEYVPPKNDFVAVKEEDAFYSKRCKLFYKKDDSFMDRGIGVLHLKPLDGKTQLLIRADTNLGNILLNIVLSESLPMSKTGKNHVLLVCIPNPPLDTKKGDSKEAIPMLIKVKTSEDADELLEILNKHKS